MYLPMGEKEQSEEFWQKKLSRPVYEALRLGKLEAPHTGAYAHTNYNGVYLCAGCETPLCDSEMKVDDSSGYATFSISPNDPNVRFVRTYSDDGLDQIRVICAACSGSLGVTSDDDMRSADDLEEGTSQNRLVHVSSNSIVLKKSLTPRNYPWAFAVFAVFFALVGFLVWSWATQVTEVANYGNIDGTLHLWVGEEELYATTVYLDRFAPATQAPVLGEDAIFVIFSQKENAPQLRLSYQAVDILWLDEFFIVIQGEQNVLPNASGVLQPPQGTVFGLVTRVGVLPEHVFRVGYEVVVVNKTELF
ncbi:MAG: Peptide methionine sulfoxide reductase MsrB [Parcubacteria group bacterium GW2011_GWA2_43_11]|nr:MAG: Peptide methionine sulfoxide reductase MsrB [Parcubacteria group bacterium GW2011_GWC2_42_11]KKS85127.1 MAG: Peptide methionine sulfoxide reductase MsrB [Parcubacteria group bacterium GW2011_GWA2_43_11]